MPKCGFVAIIGAPNAGKSTLTNSLTGSKVTIVSPKVQTTRRRVLGIFLQGDTQVILVDTPGIFEAPQRRLEKAMVKNAWDSLVDADGIMILVDASRRTFEETEKILERLEHYKKQTVLVLNKIDLIPKQNLLALAQVFARPSIHQIFMISALKGSGINDIKKYWEHALPEGPWLFPADQLTDLPTKLLAAEITREEIFNRLHDELPYAIWIEAEEWEEFKDGSLKIVQSIYVQKESQRPIVLGKGGHQIKAIRKAAQSQLMHLLARPVHLFLHVKVKTNWAENPRLYASIGLEFDKRSPKHFKA